MQAEPPLIVENGTRQAGAQAGAQAHGAGARAGPAATGRSAQSTAVQRRADDASTRAVAPTPVTSTYGGEKQARFQVAKYAPCKARCEYELQRAARIARNEVYAERTRFLAYLSSKIKDSRLVTVIRN